MQAKTRQQIAIEYGVCTRTLSKWLKHADLELPRGILNPFYINMIYTKLGPPNNTKK